MKTLRFFITCSLIVLSTFSYSQEKYTISGFIKDGKTGEELIGASVYFAELKTGGVTNVYGFYSVTVPAGKYTLLYNYLGFETSTVSLNLSENKKIDIELKAKVNNLEEVVIIDEGKKDENVKSLQMSATKLDIKEIKVIPVMFGERDVLKTIQLLPGIKSAGEGGTGFYVRGGSSDQNLILLDEAPVYNASHLLGFFSVFNSDAIKDITVYKGGIPAEYGGRVSSVLDIKMNEGNSKKFGATGGIGLISSRLTLEGPIVKDKGSFIISGRRTYADLFLKLSQDTMRRQAVLYFYDLNLKANYRITEKDRVFISGYFGSDKFGLGESFGFDWGNTTATLRWNHLFNERLFSNTSFIVSKYKYNIKIGFDDEDFKIQSSIFDYNFKEDFHFFINPKNTMKFGLNGIYHTFVPGKISAAATSTINSQELDKKYAFEYAAYVSNEQEITPLLKINYGLRYSLFSLVGPGDNYYYNDKGDAIDTVSFERGKIIKNYGGLEPRVSANYILTETSSLKASYTYNRQYLHLLSNTTSGSPTDLWIPSSHIVKPQLAQQVALGYFRNFRDNKYESSIEVYYKDMQNQIDYRNGADLVFNNQVESQLIFGKGISYGVELFVKKNAGKFTGWISYTLARTERKFDKIDNGKVFPAKQDRTHDISLVGMYAVTERLTLSSTWVFYTGNAVTFPTGKYEIDGQIVNLYSERNSYRMPAYHRLDFSVTWKNKKKKNFESDWNLSIYNVYARENAYTINFEESDTDPTKTQAKRLALFKIIPSITYSFKF